MNNTPLRKILEERFNSECTKLEMKRLYPGYEGDIKYAVVTSLSPEAFRTRYYVFFPDEKEYVLLTPEQGEAIKEFDRNNEKYLKRQKRNGIVFSIDDEDFDEHHPELYYADVADQSLTWYMNRELHRAIAELPEQQRRRFLMRNQYNMTITQIAENEKVLPNAVIKSINAAKRKLRKELSGIYHCKTKTVHWPE